MDANAARHRLPRARVPVPLPRLPHPHPRPDGAHGLLRLLGPGAPARRDIRNQGQARHCPQGHQEQEHPRQEEWRVLHRGLRFGSQIRQVSWPAYF